MKRSMFKVIGASAALFLSLGVSSSVRAFSVSNGLGIPAVATDIIQFTCPVGTAAARGAILDRNPPAALPLLRLGLFKPGLMGTAEALQEGVSGPAARLGGPGIYWAFITKTAGGVEAYTARIDCVTAAGAILPTVGAPFFTQNQ